MPSNSAMLLCHLKKEKKITKSFQLLGFICRFLCKSQWLYKWLLASN